MVITLEHGITKVDDALLCQELEIEDTIETTAVKGMVDGRAQTKHVFTHSSESQGMVKGSGPLTITPGVGDPGVDGIDEGVTVIERVKYKEGITAASEWEYSWKNYPHAEEAA